jgi:hypothetical protein
MQGMDAMQAGHIVKALERIADALEKLVVPDNHAATLDDVVLPAYHFSDVDEVHP